MHERAREFLKGPFATGFLFVPSSLGMLASTTPAEFKELVKAFYFLPDKWNQLLLWLPKPDFLTPIIINLIIFSWFMIVVIYKSKAESRELTLKELISSIASGMYSLKDIAVTLFWMILTLLIIIPPAYYVIQMHSNSAKTIIIIGVMVYLAKRDVYYRTNLLIAVGILTAMQLLYWGNFMDWIDYIAQIHL